MTDSGKVLMNTLDRLLFRSRASSSGSLKDRQLLKMLIYWVRCGEVMTSFVCCSL